MSLFPAFEGASIIIATKMIPCRITAPDYRCRVTTHDLGCRGQRVRNEVAYSVVLDVDHRS